jgi:GcrA cell cycle regulator
MSWTEERVSLLKQLWGEGKTAAEIAKELGEGVTRNAVIGKAHRLKLSSRLSPIQQNTKKQKSPEKAAPPAPRKALRNIPVHLGKQLKMEDLRDKMCRWPNGDPQSESFSFCGCASIEGSPYCDIHTSIAYQVTSRARELNAKDFAEDAGSPQELEIKTANG